MSFYVAAPTTSIDLNIENGTGIPIEERPHKEMTHIAGKQIAAPGYYLKIHNYYFFLKLKMLLLF